MRTGVSEPPECSMMANEPGVPIGREERMKPCSIPAADERYQEVSPPML
jgi:hypothetical protein